MLAKAAQSRADHVFCDLEDAVAPSAKVEARAKIVHALTTQDWTGKTRCVRINDVTTQWCHNDIIEVLIEEVQALQNVEAIAASTDRLECLIFGMGDYSASQGMDVKSIGAADGYPGDISHYARFRIAMAARSAGIDAIDGPFANFSNANAYREKAKRAKALGMVGKWAIHPSPIEPAIEVFGPTAGEVARARKMAVAYREAEAQGLGAVQVDGIDDLPRAAIAQVGCRSDAVGASLQCRGR